MSAAVIPLAIAKAAQRTQAKWGCYASVTCAQWALESAWGAHMSGKNNPFGIKAQAGEPCTNCTTWEVIGGVRRTMVQTFRDYLSIEDAFDAHGRLLATGAAYAFARSFIGKRDADGFANALTGHYATDPQYGPKLVSIMRAHQLYQYDDLTDFVPDRPAALPPPPRPIVAAAPPAPSFWQRVKGLFS